MIYERIKNKIHLSYFALTIRVKTRKYHSSDKGWELTGRSIGDILYHIKDELPHGGFMKFCKEHTPLNDTWVKRFMQMSVYFRDRIVLQGLSKSALYEVIKPSVSEEIKNEFQEKTEIRQPLSYAQTCKLIEEKENASQREGRKQERKVHLLKRINITKKNKRITKLLISLYCPIREKGELKILESIQVHIMNFLDRDLARYKNRREIHSNPQICNKFKQPHCTFNSSGPTMNVKPISPFLQEAYLFKSPMKAQLRHFKITQERNNYETNKDK